MNKIFTVLRKAAVRIPLIVVGAVLALLGIVSISASYLVPWYVNNHGEEWLGRKVYLHDSHINLFTGYLRLDSLNIYEPDAETLFFGLGQIETNLNLTDLVSGTVNLDFLNLDHLYLHATQRDSIFNFTDILDRFAADDTTVAEEPDTTGSSLPVIINHIAITQSFVHYEDLVVGADFKLFDFGVFIPGIDLTQPNASVGLNLEFVEGGSLATSIQYDDQAQTYAVNLKLNQFNISSILPYVQQSLNVGNLTGLLNAEINVEGSLLHVLDIRANGHSQFSNVSITGTAGEAIFAADSIDDHLESFSFLTQEVVLSHLHVYHPSISYSISPDSLDNVTRMLTLPADADEAGTQEADTAAADSSALWQVRIADLKVLKGEVDYADSTLALQPFAYQISDFELQAPNFDLYGKNQLQLSALLQKVGQLRMRYEGQFDDLSNTQLLLNVQNVPLSDFSPYTLPLFGSAITNGTLAVRSRTDIRNNNLDSHNNLVLYKPEVDKRHKDIEPEMKVPLRMGIYILTDKNGKCDLELPVTGNLDNPEFSFKRTILKVLGQLMVKVATSPIRSKSNNDVSDRIPFKRLLADVQPEEYEMLDQLAELLNTRSELTAQLQLHISRELAEKEYAQLPPPPAPAVADSTATTAADTSAVQVPAMPSADELIARAQQRHIETVYRYLVEQKGIASNRIQVTEAPAEEAAEATDEHAFVLKMDMDTNLVENVQ